MLASGITDVGIRQNDRALAPPDQVNATRLGVGLPNGDIVLQRIAVDPALRQLGLSRYLQHVVERVLLGGRGWLVFAQK